MRGMNSGRSSKPYRVRVGTLLIFLLLSGTIVYNMISFPSVNQSGIWHLQRLPSNELLDLFKISPTKIKTSWLYPIIDDYYRGRTLFIPDDILVSSELSVGILKTQGRLYEVITKEVERELTADEVGMIKGMEYFDIITREGNTFYFVREELDPNVPLILLKYDNQFFFIPEDLLPDPEGSL